MVKFVSGDFFDYNADIRINTVNCVGVMGAGVALEFKKKYPDMFKAYVQVCKNKEIEPGRPFVWEERDLFSECIIVNLPTKVDWRNPSEYEYIEKDLCWLKNYLIKFDNVTVTLPALGCGHGGLNWNIVKDMIMHYLSDIKAEVLVFNPQSSNENLSDYKQRISDSHIIFASDALYPTELTETFKKEIYAKGNIDLLKEYKISFILGNVISEKEMRALHLVAEELRNQDVAIIIALNNKRQEAVILDLLEIGCRLIVVIPYGLSNLKKEMQYAKYYSHLVFVTYQKPFAEARRYDYANSFKFRMLLGNRIIYCCDSIEDLNKGLKYINKNNKISYVNFWADGVKELEALGATRIGIDSRTGKPKIDSIIEQI